MNRRTQRAMDNCDLIIEAMQQTKAALPELMRRNRHQVRDGYPTTSFPSGGGGGLKASSVETTALSKPVPDPVGKAIRDLLAVLDVMTKEAINIENRRRVALHNPTPAYTPCMNCARSMPISGDGRCDACYRYKRRNGQDRPVEGERAG